ncbi:hypothetical protein Enr13x_73880 [Stieleria neptunia]|uniref:DUF1349 domain-containing protein n=1 Tax=Stieleria neptunia TaxID=2527979 RepID=A0A518I2Z2_9BACT|nr:DUF1349 domain-containing protein [Stieleria neptunia]QDV47479.1 hypothetical protein Enr13x_73880 [Stieleria neptunia]
MRTHTLPFLCMILLTGIDAVTARADEPAKTIKGWGLVEDPTNESKIDFDNKTLTLTAPDDYVDNHPSGRVNAPRVLQDVSGDFTVQVGVIHVDEAKPNSVHKVLKSFPTAYHAGSLLLRLDDRSCVRLERISKNLEGKQSPACVLEVWKDRKQSFIRAFGIEDVPTILKLERRGTKLMASFSQDDGDTWKGFPEQSLKDWPRKIKVGVSMTSNTDRGAKVQFRGFSLETTDI